MMSTRRVTTLTQADRTAGIGVLLLTLGCYLATFIGLPGNPDAEVEYQTARSIARLDGFAISEETPEGRFIIASEFDVRQGRDERWYSWFGVGQAIAAVPLYWSGMLLGEVFDGVEARHTQTLAYGQPRSEYWAHLAVGLRNPILGALTVWLVFLCARQVGVRRHAAVVASAAYGLATFAWPQARDGLSDVQATFLATLAMWLLLSIRGAFDVLKAPSPWRFAALGACLGAMVLTRVLTAPIAIVFAVATVVTAIRGRRRLWSMPLLKGQAGASRARVDLVWFAAPAFAAALFFLWSNWVRFGDPLETGYSDAVASGTFFSYPPHLGLLGVTIAPGKGLLWHAPFVLLVLFGLSKLVRDRFLLALVVGVSLAVFLPPIHTQTFHGAWTYGPRYVLPALPFLWLGAAMGFERLDRGRRRLLPWSLVGLGLITSLGGVVVDQSVHHSLALDAAAVEWSELGEGREADDQRFVAIQWDWRFAAPWAHWRIFRHRAAGLPETFGSNQIFYLDERISLDPVHERDRGFRHLAWVDLEQRLDGQPWPGVALAALLLALGVLQIVRGYDPTQH
ncbi:MAG: ArnT family glycosyltransferase [Planctomycetota bacterium]|jgi:hypothetical protein